MRVVLHVLMVVNIALVGMVAAQNHHLAGLIRSQSGHRPDPPPATVVRDPEAEAVQAAALRQLHEELTASRQELAALREAIAAQEAKTARERQDVRTELKTIAAQIDRIADSAERLGKAPTSPAADARQLKTLTDELKTLNAQFKRVIDFATGR